MMVRFCILLTSAIKPHSTAFSKRNDPVQREQDYIGVIRALAQTNYPIVYCDCSDYPLTNIKKELSFRPADTYEVLQFDGSTFPPPRGKGFGEFQIIKYATEHSVLLANCDFIVKITGRYSIENIVEILESIQVGNDTVMIADYDRQSRYTYSGLFIARPAFFTEYLFPLENFIDDSKSQFFEIALHKAIQHAVNDGKEVLPFPVKPIVSGVSGTWNVRMARGDYRAIEMSFTKVRMICRGYVKELRRRISSLFHP